MQEELDACNLLIPGGGNWKATKMIECTDPAGRAAALDKFRGIEESCFVASAGGPRVMAIADQDIECENDESTPAVHRLRLELQASARDAIRAGAAVTIGTDRPQYRNASCLSAATVASLRGDLD